jgi:Ca2+-binding RTX toxin-like protein
MANFPTNADDQIKGTAADDVIDGLAGNDIIEGKGGNDVLFGNAGNDALFGDNGDDWLLGGFGNDLIVGGAGNDRLEGQAGDDFLAGGAGNDFYIVDNLGDAVLEGPNDGIDALATFVTYQLPANFEGLFLLGNDHINGGGNELDNTIFGNNADNVLDGAGGNDLIRGLSGNDILHGGQGNDILDGGPGADAILYVSPAHGADLIQSFNPAEDNFLILASGFGGGLSSGTPLVDGVTYVEGTAPVAPTTAGTFLFDTDDFNVFWDADGSTAGAPVLLAHFDTPVNISADDFAIA